MWDYETRIGPEVTRTLRPQDEPTPASPREQRGGRGEAATIASMGLVVNKTILVNERVRSGKSLTAISREVGCDRSYLGHLEKGRKQPSYELLERLATYYRVPIHDLTTAAGAEELLEAARA